MKTSFMLLGQTTIESKIKLVWKNICNSELNETSFVLNVFLRCSKIRLLFCFRLDFYVLTAISIYTAHKYVEITSVAFEMKKNLQRNASFGISWNKPPTKQKKRSLTLWIHLKSSIIKSLNRTGINRIVYMKKFHEKRNYEIRCDSIDEMVDSVRS